MEIQSIQPEQFSHLIDSFGTDATSRDKNSFESFIADGLKEIDRSIKVSDKAIESLALGKAESTHEVVLAMEKAKLNLQMAIEVRNKIVDAYKEILRIQI